MLKIQFIPVYVGLFHSIVSSYIMQDSYLRIKEKDKRISSLSCLQHFRYRIGKGHLNNQQTTVSQFVLDSVFYWSVEIRMKTQTQSLNTIAQA